MTSYKHLILGACCGVDEICALLGFTGNGRTVHEVLHCLTVEGATDRISRNVGKNLSFSAA